MMFLPTVVGTALCSYLGLVGAACNADVAKGAGHFDYIHQCPLNSETSAAQCRDPGYCLQFSVDPTDTTMPTQYLCYINPVENILPASNDLLRLRQLT
jgi:hypothetical protein